MKSLRQLLILNIIGFAVAAGFANAQTAPQPSPAVTQVSGVLTVENEAGQKTTFTTAALSKIKRLTVKAVDHGKDATFEGVALVEVLKLAGVEFGEKLKGKRLANVVLVGAADKYQVVFALAELEPTFTDKIIIIADTRDGKPLPEKAGPWQIVVPDEKKAGRWVRQVVSLKIVSAAN